jgi:hypothetical protein
MAYGYALASSLAAAALLAGVPSGASAQCRLCSTPTTQPQTVGESEAIRIAAEATLDFDRLVLLGPGNGSATISPSGERSASGSVATVSARAMVGSVRIHGDPGRTVRVQMPPQVELYSLNGARITIDDITTDLPSLPKLDSAGNLEFQFGGRLTIDGGAEGDYRGDVPIDIDYL